MQHQEDIYSYYKKIFTRTIDAIYSSSYAQHINVEPIREANFGDFTTNASMILASHIKQSPIIIANKIIEQIKKDENLNFANLHVKGAGFINWDVPAWVLRKFFVNIFLPNYGCMKNGQENNTKNNTENSVENRKKINIEYVSANPTGPLHAGHARCAVVADVLANVLKYAGYDVVKEYYINDAGLQMQHMFDSFYYRYSPDSAKKPENFYPGNYIIDSVERFEKVYGDKYKNVEITDDIRKFFIEFITKDMMCVIKKDLHDLKITHDLFTSEKQLILDKKVEQAVDILTKKGFIYNGILQKPKGKEDQDWEEREQLLFKSTLFGDDVNRSLKKADGTWTYFASDIAYHYDKLQRGYDLLINYWGADHAGYIMRVKAAITALSDNFEGLKGIETEIGKYRNEAENCCGKPLKEINKKLENLYLKTNDKLDIKICQIVRFMQNGTEVKMSKRAGTFVTVSDVIENVGVDVLRFMMLTRRDDAQLDFDFEKVIEQCKENQVFYAQYAYARTHSILKQYNLVFCEKGGGTKILEREKFISDCNLIGDKESNNDNNCDILKGDLLYADKILNSNNLFNNEYFKSLILKLLDFPRQITLAANLLEPHKIAYYIFELSALFHSLWNYGKDEKEYRFIDENDIEATNEKIAVIFAVQKVFEAVFQIIGITPTKELR